jgi:hypothetical protein
MAPATANGTSTAAAPTSTASAGSQRRGAREASHTAAAATMIISSPAVRIVAETPRAAPARAAHQGRNSPNARAAAYRPADVASTAQLSDMIACSRTITSGLSDTIAAGSKPTHCESVTRRTAAHNSTADTSPSPCWIVMVTATWRLTAPIAAKINE